LLARSSLLVVGLTGCDFVFGVTGQPAACELASFADARETPIVEAEAFSVDWDQTFAVIQQRGLMYDASLPSGALTSIDVDVYMNVTLALAPEGNALLYTISVEPFELKGALRANDTWQLDAAVPPGAFAGTPSADSFGPRRVLVRMRSFDENVQEFVEDAGHWMPIGEPLSVGTQMSPNLTPNGLTMVFASEEGIFAASREDVDSAFADPIMLRAGPYRSPQLCGRCQQLYAITDSMMIRFDQ
jgi:hypothetical protein